MSTGPNGNLFQRRKGGEQVKAYVLVKGSMGQLDDVAMAVRKLSRIVWADAKFGLYDVIVVAPVEDLRALGVLVGHGIQSTPGVLQTCTCLAVD